MSVSVSNGYSSIEENFVIKKLRFTSSVPYRIVLDMLFLKIHLFLTWYALSAFFADLPLVL